MHGAVETAEGPISVDEANYEGNSSLVPSGVIDEGREDEGCWFVLGCERRYLGVNKNQVRLYENMARLTVTKIMKNDIREIYSVKVAVHGSVLP